MNKMFKMRRNEILLQKEYWNRYKAEKTNAPYDEVENQGKYNETAKKIINNFEAEIVDNRLNWAVGKAIGVQTWEDTPEATSNKIMEVVTKIYRKSRLNVKIKHLGRYLLSMGQAAAIIHQDGDGRDINIFTPETYNCSWKTGRNGELEAFGRRYAIQEGQDEFASYLEYYTKESISVHRSTQTFASLATAQDCEEWQEQPENITPNMFGVVPVVMCTTDEAHRPAFYSVLGLIDAYNRLVSEGVFQFEAFAQAYLVLTNYLMTTDELKKVDSEEGRKEALEKIRKMRVMMMDEAGDAKFIKREVQTEAFLAIRDTLEENINRFSRNINYSDPEVLGKATNLTVNTRTKPIDNSANDFADIIEMAVVEMFRIANNVTSKLGMPIDADLLNVVFNYDKPANVPEEAQSVATVVNAGATLEDALSMLSACENPKEWAARAEEQRTALAEEYTINPEAADDSPE